MKKYLAICILAILSLSAGSSNQAANNAKKCKPTLSKSIDEQSSKVDKLLVKLKQIK